MWNINPLLALFIFLLAVIVVLYIYWPQKGLFAKYRTAAKNTKRVLMEDALKHLYDYEIHGLVATLNSIAGNLSISADKASKIVESLKNLNLVTLDNQKITLTEGGKAYALRVIRVHRLWESYLAEETGVKELDWHDEAEKVEHTLSAEAADELSAKLGNPKFDPHGDPIPTNKGEVYFKRGEFLNNITKGTVVKITHIEDEPKAIYTKLIDSGFYPGKKIKILNKTDNDLLIAADGEERSLELLYASKLTVEVLEDEYFENEKLKTLAELKLGEEAEVITISPNCRGQQRRRLLDFGIVPGAKISIHMNNPLEDPIAYSVMETIVALRKNQASKVLIKNLELI